MSKNKTISILGCGWLGMPLAKHLQQQGYTVKGSGTSKEKCETLKQEGIQASYIEVHETLEGENTAFFFDADILVINIPPARKRTDIETYHPQQVQNIISYAAKSPVQHILFVSSTSVYPAVNTEVDEAETRTPEKASGKALKQAENMLMQHQGLKATVLRLAGLVGYDRMPGRFLAGKKAVNNGNVPVNLIHQDDCIGLINHIIEQDKWGYIFNGCAPKHPLRKDFYIRAAEKAGLTPPEFSDDQEEISYKIVNAGNSSKILNYTYKYPDPMAMI